MSWRDEPRPLPQDDAGSPSPRGRTTEADAARLVGDHPHLIGSSFPLDQAQAAAALMGATADTTSTLYFLETQAVV